MGPSKFKCKFFDSKVFTCRDFILCAMKSYLSFRGLLLSVTKFFCSLRSFTNFFSSVKCLTSKFSVNQVFPCRNFIAYATKFYFSFRGFLLSVTKFFCSFWSFHLSSTKFFPSVKCFLPCSMWIFRSFLLSLSRIFPVASVASQGPDQPEFEALPCDPNINGCDFLLLRQSLSVPPLELSAVQAPSAVSNAFVASQTESLSSEGASSSTPRPPHPSDVWGGSGTRTPRPPPFSDASLTFLSMPRPSFFHLTAHGRPCEHPSVLGPRAQLQSSAHKLERAPTSVCAKFFPVMGCPSPCPTCPREEAAPRWPLCPSAKFIELVAPLSSRQGRPCQVRPCAKFTAPLSSRHVRPSARAPCEKPVGCLAGGAFPATAFGEFEYVSSALTFFEDRPATIM